ncbi:MAG: DUF3151 family protein [Acidimicrobiales bacterium]
MLAALAAALEAPGADRRAAVAVGRRRPPPVPRRLGALGQLGRDDMERYAAFRAGYHRGLDRLRASGWRGSGYVRWAHEANRGFLRALHGLAVAAARIGEVDEQERCELFLRQLDPTWPPADLD